MTRTILAFAGGLIIGASIAAPKVDITEAVTLAYDMGRESIILEKLQID